MADPRLEPLVTTQVPGELAGFAPGRGALCRGAVLTHRRGACLGVLSCVFRDRLLPPTGPRAAALIANEETSSLAAAIVTADQGAAAEFLGAYAGTGAFWNATTRLLDGFKLLSVPETGINIDAVPGPRGPVTFRDLYLRQFVVTPVPD